MSGDLRQRAGIAAWVALALLQIIWHAWLLPSVRTPMVMVLAIALVPLAIPLVYWRRPRRALLLAGVVSLLYFCHGVAGIWTAPHARVLAALEVALAVTVVLGSARMPKRRRAAESKLSSS